MSDFWFYFKIGWEHIINKEALDHIFFIMALAAIYMLKDWRQVLILVTAFTIGHTVTLALSTLRLIEVNSNLVEFLIPCTIVLTAVSNLFMKTFTPRSVRINYFLALFFGLVHGLAFANTLRMIIAEDQSFALSMFSFSVGLELGQILIVFCILLLAQLSIGGLKVNRREWVIFVSALVFGLAMEMAVGRWPGVKNIEQGTSNI
ncbi:MAG TPA: HupE/UreJ family protein, partial [Flavisolibacter sp.]|nr:HupE/UreJ family protein [Flavisolibacter sp.]